MTALFLPLDSTTVWLRSDHLDDHKPELTSRQVTDLIVLSELLGYCRMKHSIPGSELLLLFYILMVKSVGLILKIFFT